jgi:hypothetical protein
VLTSFESLALHANKDQFCMFKFVTFPLMDVQVASQVTAFDREMADWASDVTVLHFSIPPFLLVR